MKQNDPAFPSPAFDACALPGCDAGPMSGMSLLAHFSIQLLPTAIMLHAKYGEDHPDPDEAEKKHNPEVACKLAIACAKTLIAELNKESQP